MTMTIDQFPTFLIQEFKVNQDVDQRNQEKKEAKVKKGVQKGNSYSRLRR